MILKSNIQIVNENRVGYSNSSVGLNNIGAMKDHSRNISVIS